MDKLEDIERKDISENFIHLMKVYAPDNEYNIDFVNHMRNAAIMSHYKYGWVMDKPSSHYKMLAGFEDKAFNKDKNLEHMVNVANYAMYRFMTNEVDPAYVENPQELIATAVAAMIHYNHPEEGEHYTGIDSDKSVTHKRVKPVPVRDHLYKRITEGSAYEFFTDMVEEHLNLL